MRTKCDEVRQALPAAAGQEPDAAVAGHLAGCAECREVLADLRLLRADPNPEMPPYLTMRVMARVREIDGVPGRRFALARVAGVAAALVLVVLGVWVGAGLGREIMSESIGRREALRTLLLSADLAGADTEAR
jgi:predicted anti-sigma-YlaC factor YlaD